MTTSNSRSFASCHTPCGGQFISGVKIFRDTGIRTNRPRGRQRRRTKRLSRDQVAELSCRQRLHASCSGGFRLRNARTSAVGMFTVNRLTENFRLTGLSVNRTETGNMATSKKAVI